MRVCMYTYSKKSGDFIKQMIFIRLIKSSVKETCGCDAFSNAHTYDILQQIRYLTKPSVW